MLQTGSTCGCTAVFLLNFFTARAILRLARPEINVVIEIAEAALAQVFESLLTRTWQQCMRYFALHISLACVDPNITLACLLRICSSVFCTAQNQPYREKRGVFVA